MNNRRLGRIRISIEMIDHDHKDIIDIFAIMKLVPVRAEFIYCSNEVEYIAISDRFEIVPEGHIIPEYAVDVTYENGKVKYVKVVLKWYIY